MSIRQRKILLGFYDNINPTTVIIPASEVVVGC